MPKLVFFITLLLVSSLKSHEASGSGRTFFFGDSLTDTGNIADILGTIGDGYPGSSFSNGPTWLNYFEPSLLRLQQALPDLVGTPQGPQSIIYGPTDLSAGGATTQTILNQQIGVILDFFPPAPNDRAFLWGGGNDLLDFFSEPISPNDAAISAFVTTGVGNLTDSVTRLSDRGIREITVISPMNIGLSPRGTTLTTQGAEITHRFNTRLRSSLSALSPSSRLLWIDSNAFLNDAINHPGAYGLTNTTDPAAPDAQAGIPSPLTPAEQRSHLFYDDIHPTTGVHEQFARYVSSHLSLKNEASSLFLVTDSALALDDRFGFETSGIKSGNFDFNVSTFHQENQSSPHRRRTTGVRAGLNYALSDHFLLGGGFLYSQGESARTDLESKGLRLDLAYRHSFGKLAWELGLGAGSVWGNLSRDYDLGTFRAQSDQETQIFTAHSALRNPRWKLWGMDAHWEIGLKQRFVRRHAATESGAASLDLAYSGESLHTTLANLEIGLRLNSKLELQLSLNPVLYHHGGEIRAQQANGLAEFTVSDQSGYDVHMARVSLIYAPSESSAFTATIVAGSESTWTTNLGYHFRF